MSNQTNNGIHRAKVWQLGGFALNNVSTNAYMWMMMFLSYFLTGFTGVAVVVASTTITAMRIWDGVTDPFVGYIVDKTDGKLGKNRPFIIIGQVIMCTLSAVIFFGVPKLPEKFRFIAFILLYAVYIIGYTCQCVVTKSAQSCLTNDPNQRPVFSVFNGIFTATFFAVMPMFSYTYLLQKHGNQFNEGFFADQWVFCVILSAVTAAIAFLSLMEKDRTEYYGTGKPTPVKLREYWEILKKNRALQMLIVSASTDKLASTTKSDATVTTIIYAIICGNAAVSGMVSSYTTVPNVLFVIFGAGLIAAKLGQKRSIQISSLGGCLCASSLIALFIFGDPTTLSLPGDGVFNGWTTFSILFIALTVIFNGFIAIGNAVTITMTADITDYEVYRSGKYVPGLIGTVFSFVDKFISSFGSTIVGLMCAAIGFTSTLPQPDTPYSTSLFVVGLIGMYGLVLIGLVCNLIAMKFYPLTKEKMAEIQDEIARIKAEHTAA